MEESMFSKEDISEKWVDWKSSQLKNAVIHVRQALGHLDIQEVRDVGFCRKRILSRLWGT